MTEFNLKSRFKDDLGIREVQFGKEKPILEVELNEMQEIQRFQLAEIAKLLTTEEGVILKDHVITYTNGTLTIVKATVLNNGELIKIANLKLTGLANSNKVYLEHWDKQVTKDSTLYEQGSEGGNAKANYIQDPRLGRESSRRVVRATRLSKTKPSNPSILLGTIVSGNFVRDIKEVDSLGGGAGYKLKGNAMFAGNNLSRTISIPPQEDTNYVVVIQPSGTSQVQNPNGTLGEIYVEKKIESFIVKNTGSAKTQFDYIVF